MQGTIYHWEDNVHKKYVHFYAFISAQVYSSESPLAVIAGPQFSKHAQRDKDQECLLCKMDLHLVDVRLSSCCSATRQTTVRGGGEGGGRAQAQAGNGFGKAERGPT